MSHPNRWRCSCGTTLGVVKRVAEGTALDLDRDTVKRLLLGPRGPVGVCDSCDTIVTFESFDMACTSAS